MLVGDQLLDRGAYCKAVGIHPSTLSRWIREGIVEPRWLGHLMFTEEDVTFGRGLIAMLDRHRGRYTLGEMAEIVRNERELEATRSPPGAPDPRLGSGIEGA